MRSGKKRTMTLPFEVEYSNFIREQRRYRGLWIWFHFFSIPSQFKIEGVQSSAIFKSKKIRIFFVRQLILQAAQVKNKKSASHIFLQISSSFQISDQIFCSYNSLGWTPTPTEHFSIISKSWDIGLQSSCKILMFSNTCQKSLNCRKTFSRPAMSCPGIGQQPPGISFIKKKNQWEKSSRNAPPWNVENLPIIWWILYFCLPDLTRNRSTYKIFVHIHKTHHFLLYRNKKSDLFYLNI